MFDIQAQDEAARATAELELAYAKQDKLASENRRLATELDRVRGETSALRQEMEMLNARSGEFFKHAVTLIRLDFCIFWESIRVEKPI